MKPLDKIIQMLIINGTLTEQSGLFYGKTGIAIFFFHYAQQTDNIIFQRYAMELIREVQKQITFTNLVRYDVGLAGIGAGFEYFLQKGFIEIEDSDFFKDFDTQMYQAVKRESYNDLSLDGGLTGLGRYFIYRLRGKLNKNEKLHKALTKIAQEISKKIEKKKVSENMQPDVYRFFSDLNALSGYADRYYSSLQQCGEWKCIREPDIKNLFPNMNKLQRLQMCQRYFNLDLTNEIEQEWKKWEESENNSLTNMGLLNGWTAEGMLYLTYFHNHSDAWLNLL